MEKSAKKVKIQIYIANAVISIHDLIKIIDILFHNQLKSSAAKLNVFYFNK